jgi:endo-1,4-beta-xylanase
MNRIRVLLLLMAPLLLPGFPGVGRAGPDCLAPGADCSLREAAAQAGVRIGSAARSGVIASDPNYGPVLAAQFNSLTGEGEMKWGSLHPAPGVYDFSNADALVAFAEAHDMAVRGHTLVWAQEFVDSTPDYVKAMTDPNVLRAELADHIQTVAGHFKGHVDSWDVVNEPLELFGDQLYQNIFHQLLGPGYIAEAFHLAHAADPNALLFLNEVVDTPGAKLDGLVALVTDLLAQEVPIHGVGIQGHFLFAANPQNLQTVIQTFADMGLLVELTEVDIVLMGDGTYEEKLDAQSQSYFGVAAACRAVSACQRVTLWGFTDRYTWIDDFFGPGLDPLPFDEVYARKPAFYGLREGLLTRVATAQDKDQQKCVNELNKNGAKVAKAQGKENAKCVKDALKDQISSAEACLAGAKDKVEQAKTRAIEKAATKCDPINSPNFGATDPNTQNSVMVAKELGLIHDLFGSDLDQAIVVGDTDKVRANCQIEVTKLAAKCQDTKLKTFNGCKKAALKGKAPFSQVTHAHELQIACLQDDPNDPATGIPDPKRKIAKACKTKLGEKLGQKCTGVGFGTAFPGRCSTAADASDLAVCVDQRVECRVCLALNAVDNLARGCDEFDDGAVNGSCP